MKCMRHRTTYHRHEMTKKFSGIYKNSVNAESTLFKSDEYASAAGSRGGLNTWMSNKAMRYVFPLWRTRSGRGGISIARGAPCRPAGKYSPERSGWTRLLQECFVLCAALEMPKRRIRSWNSGSERRPSNPFQKPMVISSYSCR
jgi:hypothetical protein